MNDDPALVARVILDTAKAQRDDRGNGVPHMTG